MERSLGDQLRDSIQVPTFDPGPPPAFIEDVDDDWATRAEPTVDPNAVVPPSQRWYRRKGLAPRWMMRTRETQLERARGAHVRRDDPEPELRVDLLRDTLQRRDPPPQGANEDGDGNAR